MPKYKDMKYLFILIISLVCQSYVPAATVAGDVIKYNDGVAEGKRSLGGSGEAIRFTEKGKEVISGVRIHCSRYGMDSAPQESALLYLLNDKCDAVIHTELLSYSTFEKGDEKWVDVVFMNPVEVQGPVWVVIDFRAGQKKGVFVSYDTSTKGKYSKVGLPGMAFQDVDMGGDWMIELKTSKSKTKN